MTPIGSWHSTRPELKSRSGTEGLSGRMVPYDFLQWGALQGLGSGNWGPGVVPWCITSRSFGNELALRNWMGGGGREASVCRALPPTLRNEGWKLILGKGTDKVSVLGSSCALFPLSGLQLPSLLPSSRVNTGWREVEELIPCRPVPGPAFGDTPPLLTRRVSAWPEPSPGPVLSEPRTLGLSSHWD